MGLEEGSVFAKELQKFADVQFFNTMAWPRFAAFRLRNVRS
jgi:hypothetical protein